MDKRTAETASGALARLNRMVDDGELVIFSADEAQALREVALLWSQLKAVVSLGGTIGKGMKWLVGFVVTWLAFKAGMFDWLRAGLGK